MGRFWRALASVALSAGVLVGCGGGQSGAGLPPEIKFGFVSQLTSSAAASGQAAERGATFAVEEVNASGGIKGSRLTLISYDDKLSPAEAVQVVTRLVNTDKVAVVVGPMASTNVLSSMEVTQKARIPQIAYMSGAPEITQKGDKFILRMAANFPDINAKLADFTAKKLNAKRVAIMVQSDDFGMPTATAYEEAARKLGMEVVAKESFATKDQSFQGQLLKIKAANPDVLLLAGYQVEVALIAKQARELGINAQFIGGNTLSVPDYAQIGGAAAENSIYVTNYHSEAPGATEAMKQFIKKWQNRYGRDPDVYEAHAYDGVMVAAKAIETVGKLDGEAIVDAILKLKEYPAVSGTTTYLPNGDVQKSVVINKISGGKGVPIAVY